MVESRRTLRPIGRVAGKVVAVVAIAMLVAGCGKATGSGGAGNSGGNNGGFPDDACPLLSSAEVSMATGFEVGVSTHPVGSDNLTCHWDGPADSAGKAQSVELVLDPGATHYKGATGGTVKGVGDSAYLNSSSGSLMVKVGDNAFWVADSAAPSDDALAVETTLAKLVIPRLAK